MGENDDDEGSHLEEGLPFTVDRSRDGFATAGRGHAHAVDGKIAD